MSAGLCPPRARVRLVSIRRVSNPCVPSWKRAMADPTGSSPAVRCVALDGAVLGVRRWSCVCGASPVPLPGPTPGRCMRDDEDGVGSVVACRPAFVGGGAASAGRSRPSVCPGSRPCPLRFFGPRCPMSTACFRAAACIVPFGRVLAGFFVMGLCAAVRACWPSPFAVAAGTRCRTMAPHPMLGCPAPVSGRAVARDRRGPSKVPLAPFVRFGSGSPTGGALPRSRAESVESEHAALGPPV